MGDYTYRTREEVEIWRERCPILYFRGSLEDEGLVEPAELAALEAEVAGVVADAQQFAENSPWPEAASATRFVYDESRGTETVLDGPPRPDGAIREISFMQATLEAIGEEMARDPRIFVMGEGTGKRGGNFRTTAGLFDRYGQIRLCDTPICERGFVGLSCGAAMTGTRPVIDFMFAYFVLDGVGEIVNQIAKIAYMSSGRLKMPVVLRGCIGFGHSAATHHSGNYYALFAQFPGLRVVVPSNPRDARGLLKHPSGATIRSSSSSTARFLPSKDRFPPAMRRSASAKRRSFVRGPMSQLSPWP
jgi:2-oxoisovalerate dehydrogenase E1 component